MRFINLVPNELRWNYQNHCLQLLPQWFSLAGNLLTSWYCVISNTLLNRSSKFALHGDSEAATRGVLWKKVFLEIFSMNFEISKNIFFIEHLSTTASGDSFLQTLPHERYTINLEKSNQWIIHVYTNEPLLRCLIYTGWK